MDEQRKVNYRIRLLDKTGAEKHFLNGRTGTNSSFLSSPDIKGLALVLGQLVEYVEGSRREGAENYDHYSVVLEIGDKPEPRASS